MSLVINHNSMASNAARNLGRHYGGMASSVRRLSSGLRVGTAADDAAGLAIRELMRADIAALNQGVRNANDAISLIQTADGALGIIDEKLNRMKELAEQAATGTYNSDQRLMIDSEFQAMAAEIDRIAKATDFNGIKLLDGSRTGQHNGSGLESTGELKVHFGAGNDSAEDYYYLNIGEATIFSLFGLGRAGLGTAENMIWEESPRKAPRAGVYDYYDIADGSVILNDHDGEPVFRSAVGTKIDWSAKRVDDGGISYVPTVSHYPPSNIGSAVQNNLDEWYDVGTNMFYFIPKGTKNITINMYSYDSSSGYYLPDNDLQLYSVATGKHLAGTPLTDPTLANSSSNDFYLESWQAITGHDKNTHDDSPLNTGPSFYDGTSMSHVAYNGMNIYYTGDPDRLDDFPDNLVDDTKNNGAESLFIDEVTEDLYLVVSSGITTSRMKVAAGSIPPDTLPAGELNIEPIPILPGSPEDPDNPSGLPRRNFHIKTQQAAQKMLTQIDEAIIRKDSIRAHLGAMQNRLENTISNLQIQAENLQAAESRISDVDVAEEMTKFVRLQVLTQAATAMLSQANSMPQMALQLIG